MLTIQLDKIDSAECKCAMLHMGLREKQTDILLNCKYYK